MTEQELEGNIWWAANIGAPESEIAAMEQELAKLKGLKINVDAQELQSYVELSRSHARALQESNQLGWTKEEWSDIEDGAALLHRAGDVLSRAANQRKLREKTV